ncbi:MAG: LysR substrate-binding domain-containing protein, partial [Microbacterium sp.]
MSEPYRPGYAGGMAKGGSPRGRSGRPAPTGRAARPKRDAAPPPQEPPAISGPFVLGAIPGATPGGWIDAWQERMPQSELELRPISVADQRTALLERGLDAALVRLPIDASGLHIIPLYDEIAVVVSSADSHLTAADELTLA